MLLVFVLGSAQSTRIRIPLVLVPFLICILPVIVTSSVVVVVVVVVVFVVSFPTRIYSRYQVLIMSPQTKLRDREHAKFDVL